MPPSSIDEPRLLDLMAGARRILFSQCSAFPRRPFELLASQADIDVEVVCGLVFGQLEPVGPGVRVTTWQPNGTLGAATPFGYHRVLPLRFSELAAAFGPGGAYPADLLVVQVSPETSERPAYCSLGLGADYTADLVGRITTIAQVNPRMPYTYGDSEIPLGAIDYLLRYEEPLAGHIPGPADSRIGDYVASLIRPGDVLQVGLGAAPQGVLKAAGEVSGLSVFGSINDQISDLLREGLLDGTGEVVDGRREVVVSQVVGGASSWAYADGNRQVRISSSRRTHHLDAMSSMPQFVAVMSGLQVDIHGQVNAEQLGGRQRSGVGGQLDFAIGAKASPSGRCIVCLPSETSSGRSRIVERVELVTTPRFLVDYVVTEHGIASLRGLGARERSEQIIQVAAPSVRADLESALEAASSERVGVRNA